MGTPTLRKGLLGSSLPGVSHPAQRSPEERSWAALFVISEARRYPGAWGECRMGRKTVPVMVAGRSAVPARQWASDCPWPHERFLPTYVQPRRYPGKGSHRQKQRGVGVLLPWGGGPDPMVVEWATWFSIGCQLHGCGQSAKIHWPVHAWY